MLTMQQIKAIQIDGLIIAEAIELAAAIYAGDNDTVHGYADYLVDEVTSKLGEYDLPPDIITQMLAEQYNGN